MFPLRSAVSVAARAYPLKSGYTRISRLRPLHAMTSEHELGYARLRNGDKLFVDLGDQVGRAIYYLGDYDPKITWLCRRILRPGDTMLDVGANMGVVSMYSSDFVGPEGRVHAFEPQPRLVEWLKRSLTVNARRNVTVHPVALSDSDGSLPLHGRPGNLGSASLEDEAEPGQELLAVAEVRRSGDYLRSLDLAPIRLLKIDVEGHEEAFFRGALDFLAGNAPQAIVFESHGPAPFFERPVARILRDLGYRFYQVPKARFRMRVEPVADGATDVPGFDFLAAAPGADIGAALG